MSPRDRYRKLCEIESTIPIFAKDWWLDAVCGEDQWDVALVEKGDDIVASMPFTIRNKLGITILGQPQLTQSLGPWMKDSGAETKSSNRLGYQKRVYASLLENLPKFHIFKQNWDVSQTNWLPFYWAGFQQTTKYTYRFDDLSDLDAIWSGLRSNIRGDIKKATTKFGVALAKNPTIEDFLILNSKTYERQGGESPESESLIRRLYKACVEKGSARLFIAEDESGRGHAGAFVVSDEMCSYYLMGGGDPEVRNSGATSYCLWEAIQYASTVSRSFDFEGSMIEPIERFFRAFDAAQTPYFELQRVASKRIESILFVLSLLRK